MAVMLTANVAALPTSNPGTDTTTPIKHVVVIFQENVSFDHYFGTYPNATNPPNEPPFTAAPGTPNVNGLSGPLLTSNPNELVTGNSSDNPARLDRTQPVTCDNDHDYTAEQAAFNGGLMNMFPEQTSCSDGIVMDYYDGNTVTGLWNYAQDYALNDNAFGTTFGPSTPGALNVVSGIGGPMLAYLGPRGTTNTTSNLSGVLANGQVIGDSDPVYDDCSYTSDGSTSTIGMTPTSGTGAPQNVGNLLNEAGVTWGWFQGGFTPTVPYNPVTGSPAVCGSSHVQVGGTTETDYSPHHEPFQYFASTANPHHLPPSSPSMIGYTDQANHQYDLSSFWIAADSGNLPAVSFLKADRYQDGHPANSDPLDEQTWLINTINKLESLPTWSSTAIIINWDDSDGWYDSVMPPIVNPSSDPANDVLNGNSCGAGTSPLGVEDRCGYGPRIPILVISPYAKQNFVDNTLASQTAITKFIEDNWRLGSVGPTSFDNIPGTIDNMFNFNHPARQDKLYLNPQTGEPVQTKGGPFGSGLGFGVTLPSTCTDQDTNPDVCAIRSTFGKAQVAAGDYIWFNSVMNLNTGKSGHGSDTTTTSTATIPSTGLTVHFSGQWIDVQLEDGATLQLPAPNAEVVYSPTATTATTTFTGGQWVTTVPISYTGNVFLAGLAYQAPAGISMLGARVTWTGAFSGTTSSFNLKWEWGGAAYSSFGTLNLSNTNTLYNGLGVKPIDASAGSASPNGDLAGTPENFKANAIGGVSGYGGSSFTGAYSQMGTASYQAYLLNE
jgi:phospholipase C